MKSSAKGKTNKPSSKDIYLQTSKEVRRPNKTQRSTPKTNLPKKK